MQEFDWDRTNPFVLDVAVTEDCVDGYGHVSTHHYIRWLIDCCFAHSAAVGLPDEKCQELQRGMAVHDMRVTLIASAYDGDKLKVANWIVRPDGKLRVSRQFQIVDAVSGKSMLRAEFDFICTNLSNGRPVRMPESFAAAYIVESDPHD